MRILFFIATTILTGCSVSTYKVEEFSNEELKWYKPFDKTDTVIFISDKDEKDTIIFQATVTASDSTRDFEQGFSNTNYLTVNYYFTNGSYHQFAMMSGGIIRYDQNFVNAYKSSARYSSLEICFIGTIFSDSIKNIQKLDDSTYFFDSNKADYSGINIENGINSFTFNTRLGVTEFVDDRNIKWFRNK